MALFGSLSTVEAQLADHATFAAAYAYLKEALDPTSAVFARIGAVQVGDTQRVDLADGSFALEQAYYSKPSAEGRYESHQAYIDLQAIVGGEEFIEVADIGHLTVNDAQWAERDVAFYEDFAAGSRWRLSAGEIAVFFPVDGHKPSLVTTEPAVVRKTVVKVPVLRA